MGQKMKNAPVYFALAQVRFNPLAVLETYVPTIQDSLRKAGYPDFKPSQLAQLILGAPMPKPAVVTRYLFLDASQTSGFSLDQASFSYHTTNYDTFEPFLTAFFNGLRVVHGETVLSYSERVGVRFLDAVSPLPGETVSQYLQPYVLGLTDRLEGRQLVHSVSETRTALGKTTLVGRAIIQKQETPGAAFPEDLQPMPLKLTEKSSKISGTYAIIDTDSWIEDRENFDLDSLEKTLRSLHNDVRRSFDLMITPHALKVWE